MFLEKMYQMGQIVKSEADASLPRSNKAGEPCFSFKDPGGSYKETKVVNWSIFELCDSMRKLDYQFSKSTTQ